MNIKPINNIIYARIYERSKVNSEPPNSIVLPDQQKTGRFIKLEVLDVGNTVEVIVKGDKVIANNLFEVIDSRQKDIGFINSKDVLGIIKDE